MKKAVTTILLTAVAIAAFAQIKQSEVLNIQGIETPDLKQEFEIIEAPTGAEIISDDFYFIVDLSTDFEKTETLILTRYYREKPTDTWKRLWAQFRQSSKLMISDARHEGEFYYLVQCDCVHPCYAEISVNWNRKLPLRYEVKCPM